MESLNNLRKVEGKNNARNDIKQIFAKADALKYEKPRICPENVSDLDLVAEALPQRSGMGMR